MKVTLVMASGAEIDFECDDASIKSNYDNDLSSLTLKNVKGRNFLFVKLRNVDAVLFEKKEEDE